MIAVYDNRMTLDEQALRLLVVCLIGWLFYLGIILIRLGVDALQRQQRRDNAKARARHAQEARGPADAEVDVDRRHWEPAPEYKEPDPLTNPPGLKATEIPAYGLSPEAVPPSEPTLALVPHAAMSGDASEFESAGRHGLFVATMPGVAIESRVVDGGESDV